MKKRMMALFLTGVMTASLFAGCGSAKDESNGGESSNGEISGEISFAYWDQAQGSYFEECAKEFQKIYPDVTVKLEPSAWDEYWTKLEAGATGGSVADVMTMNGPNIVKYAKGGVLMPIDDMIKEAGIDLSKYPEALVNLYNIDGKQYAIPKDFDTIGVWYNKDLFEEAGVPFPSDDWTWEEMADIAKQLTKDDGSVYGIASSLRTQTGVYNTIFAHDGYVISEDKKSSGFDKPETQAGVQDWVTLQEEGVTPSIASLDETEDYVQFLSGRIAMLWSGSWFLNQVIDSDLKDSIDVAAVPSINGKKASVIHGVGNCISKSTDNPEAAFKWVEFLASKEINQLSAEMGAAIPAYEGTADEWVEKNSGYNLKVFTEAAEEYAYPYPASENTAEWEQYIMDNLKVAFNMETDVKDACDNIAEQMNQVLEREGK